MAPEVAGSHGSAPWQPLGAVLAGGMGLRLGGRKQMRPLAGRELISYPLRAVVEAGIEPLVVAKPGGAIDLGVEVALEPSSPVHPLLGIVTALERAGSRPVLAVACDMPLITPELLAWIASRPQRLAVPRVGGRLQPLLARYEPSLLPALRAGLEEERPLQAVVESLGPTELGEEEIASFGDPERLMLNVNTGADLERAESYLEQAAGRRLAGRPRRGGA